MSIESLIENNKTWATDVNNKNPQLFKNTANSQFPKYLWFGCSDSRVPESSILGLPPGEIFTHRNIANQIHSDDNSMLSVLDYAVNALGIRDIIICGHYNCGGVEAAVLQKDVNEPTASWISPIYDKYIEKKSLFDQYQSQEDKLKAACKFNVVQQVISLSKLSVILKSWEGENPCNIYGLIYDVATGMIKNLDITVSSITDVLYLEK